jgi:hypothetical protein
MILPTKIHSVSQDKTRDIDWRHTADSTSYFDLEMPVTSPDYRFVVNTTTGQVRYAPLWEMGGAISDKWNFPTGDLGAVLIYFGWRILEEGSR